jgi:hypothetical protein
MISFTVESLNTIFALISVQEVKHQVPLIHKVRVTMTGQSPFDRRLLATGAVESMYFNPSRIRLGLSAKPSVRLDADRLVQSDYPLIGRRGMCDSSFHPDTTGRTSVV